jgi:hypothetical protein
MGRSVFVIRTPSSSGGKPWPSRPRSLSGACCRRCCPKASIRSATMGWGVPLTGHSCIAYSSGWRVWLPPRPQLPRNRQPVLTTATLHPSGQARRVRTAGTAVLSCCALFHDSKGGRHEGPSFRLDFPRPHHRNTACRLWLPGTGASVSRKPFWEDRAPPTSLALVAIQPPTLQAASSLPTA